MIIRNEYVFIKHHNMLFYNTHYNTWWLFLFFLLKIVLSGCGQAGLSK